MKCALALLAMSILAAGCSHEPVPISRQPTIGPFLVRVETVTRQEFFDGNQIETWRRFRFRIVGTANARWEEFAEASDRRIDAFDSRDVSDSDALPCPRAAPGEGIYLVQLRDAAGRRPPFEGVRYVLASCLVYDRATSYGYSLLDGER